MRVLASNQFQSIARDKKMAPVDIPTQSRNSLQLWKLSGCPMNDSGAIKVGYQRGAGADGANFSLGSLDVKLLGFYRGGNRGVAWANSFAK
jgi:hypothetical protein